MLYNTNNNQQRRDVFLPTSFFVFVLLIIVIVAIKEIGKQSAFGGVGRWLVLSVLRYLKAKEKGEKLGGGGEKTVCLALRSSFFTSLVV